MKKTRFLSFGLMAASAILALGTALTSSPVAAPKPGGCTDLCQRQYDKCVRTTRNEPVCFNQFCDCMCACGPGSCIC